MKEQLAALGSKLQHETDTRQIIEKRLAEEETVNRSLRLRLDNLEEMLSSKCFNLGEQIVDAERRIVLEVRGKKYSKASTVRVRIR